MSEDDAVRVFPMLRDMPEMSTMPMPNPRIVQPSVKWIVVAGGSRRQEGRRTEFDRYPADVVHHLVVAWESGEL